MSAPGPVGVLALQGDVRNHVELLGRLGIEAVEVRTPEDLDGVVAVILPGGESTTISLLLSSSGLLQPLRAALDSGLPAFGTCAGMILLSRQVLDGRADQEHLGAIDIAVRRNAFGRQVDSFETDLEVDGVGGGPVRAVFIRAPVVEATGDAVEVLATVEGRDGVTRPVICRQGRILVAAFHPELSGDPRVHEYFLQHVAAAARAQS